MCHTSYDELKYDIFLSYHYNFQVIFMWYFTDKSHWLLFSEESTHDVRIKLLCDCHMTVIWMFHFVVNIGRCIVMSHPIMSQCSSIVILGWSTFGDSNVKLPWTLLCNKTSDNFILLSLRTSHNYNVDFIMEFPNDGHMRVTNWLSFKITWWFEKQHLCNFSVEWLNVPL